MDTKLLINLDYLSGIESFDNFDKIDIAEYNAILNETVDILENNDVTNKSLISSTIKAIPNNDIREKLIKYI